MFFGTYSTDDTGTGGIQIWSGGPSAHKWYEFSSAAVLNYSLDDLDVIIQGDTDNALLCTNAGTDRVGVGTRNPDYKFHVVGISKATNFISDVATGTSPYACTSTTLNTNLNADLIDGMHVVGTGYTLTVPTTGTAALLAVANIFTAAQKINVNSTTALFIEQDGVKDNVFIVDTTNAYVGIGIVPTLKFQIADATAGGTFQMTNSIGNNNGLSVYWGASRGTVASPSNSVNGDNLVSFYGLAYSNAWKYGIGGWSIVVDGTFTAGQNPPSAIIFSTNIANGSLTNRVYIDKLGHMILSNSTVGLTANARLDVQNAVDEVQFSLKGPATQSNAIAQDLDSSGNVHNQRYVAHATNVNTNVFNEQGSPNLDFRIESDTESNMFFLDSDGSTNGLFYLGGTTNGTIFPKGGKQVMLGTARVQKELRIQAYATHNGVSAPTETTRAVGASGTVEIPVLQFSKTSQQDVYFVFHAPEDMDYTVPASFHLMWQPGAAWTSGNYMWKLEYLIMNGNGATLLAGTPTTISADITPSNATTNLETTFAGDITLAIDQMMVCHFYRDVANDNADDVGSVGFFEIHYTSNKLGE